MEDIQASFPSDVERGNFSGGRIHSLDLQVPEPELEPSLDAA